MSAMVLDDLRFGLPIVGGGRAPVRMLITFVTELTL
jgi:hypothetical protein